MPSDTPVELPLRKVVRSKLAEQVAQEILDQIRSADLPRGARMASERELMQQLGVGRSTIREAVNGLAMMGVLEIRHGYGAVVANPNAGQTWLSGALSRGVTNDLFEVRRLVEVESARLAAIRRSDADIEQISEALRRHEQALERGEPAAQPSVEFHVRVATATGNDLFLGLVRTFADALAERGEVLEQLDGYREWEIEQHRAVFEPIKSQDADVAAEAMLRHLDEVVVWHERLGPAGGDRAAGDS